ncbi:ethanolaminephosphotransferase 1-like [Varroa jacobsoni]|uniref:ethanolaminephosphotransferase 1-like n=1 Tax=Varroa jacobsoni TaxID=62625 RepID=UPI000BF4DAF0|nr:ethanolaminephosphotransferase 1-like [Varroa jacobsoni]XP_022688568.1 ethanolaminephosphotransferase 1-like [Varroa jacobsoni]XP_022688569.1 ethanolaminephosphotransferase 1-like [Varroa jacobsoni]XP_022688570.1 ethanolaminephosphotransferase 1-like [Varroa jacobsoni]
MLPDPIRNLAGPTARQLDVVEQTTHHLVSLSDRVVVNGGSTAPKSCATTITTNITITTITNSSSSSSVDKIDTNGALPNNNSRTTSRPAVGQLLPTSTASDSVYLATLGAAALSASECENEHAARSSATTTVTAAAAAAAVLPRKSTQHKQQKPRFWRRRPDAMDWEVDYLSKEQLTGFDNYKYSAIDTSPLSNYVMHPFWNQCVKLVPRSVAPNCLTFGGFMLNVLSLCLLSWYDFDFYASSDDHPSPPVPKWVWLVCAFNQFMAHTLDGIDGKHARRTGLCGPMGELFDHGLDSWATLFMPVCVYSVFGRLNFAVSAWRYYLILWDVHYCFLASHWEKYNTGILFLPWGYDVSQIFLTCTFLLTFVYGHTFWKFTLLGYPSGLYMEAALHFGAAGLGLPVSLWNIYKGYQAKTLRHHSLWEGMRPLVAPTIFFALTTIWVLSSPTSILETQPRVMFVMIGTLFSNIATRLIINQMTTTRCDLFNIMLALVLATLFAVFGLRWNETYCLYTLTAAVLVGHIHYAICVVRQMCDHFRINCFSVQRRAPKKID